MNGSIDLVILDCDGVLIDSELLVVEVKVLMLAELGWTLTRQEVIDRFVGRSSEFMRGEIEAHVGRRLPDDWEVPFQSEYRRAWKRSLRPVEGVLEALDRIRPTRDCVASNATHDQLRFTLGLTGLYERFAGGIFSLEDVRRGKPRPTCSCTPPRSSESSRGGARSWRKRSRSAGSARRGDASAGVCHRADTSRIARRPGHDRLRGHAAAADPLGRHLVKLAAIGRPRGHQARSSRHESPASQLR